MNLPKKHCMMQLSTESQVVEMNMAIIEDKKSSGDSWVKCVVDFCEGNDIDVEKAVPYLCKEIIAGIKEEEGESLKECIEHGFSEF